MTDCNDSEEAVTVYCVNDPWLMGMSHILVIKIVLAPEDSYITSYFKYGFY